MAYEPSQLHRFDTYGVYNVYLSDEDRQQFLSADDPTSLVRQILAAGGAPEPNEIIVRQPSTDSVNDLIDQIIKDITTGGGGSPPPPAMPHATIFHQESGEHISRYIVIVIP